MHQFHAREVRAWLRHDDEVGHSGCRGTALLVSASKDGPSRLTFRQFLWGAIGKSPLLPCVTLLSRLGLLLTR